MKKIIIATIYLLSIYSPTKGAEDSSKILTCIEFIHITPTINFEGKLDKYLIDTTHFYYYEGITIMENKLNYRYRDDKFPSKNYDQKQTQYWLFKKGDMYGYLLDTFNKTNNKWLLLDSFIKKQPYYLNGGYLYDAVVEADLKLISSTSENDNKILHEKYFCVNKLDTTLKAYLYFSYDSSLNDIDFSLSTKLDSVKGMKLCYNKVVTLKRYWPKGKMNIDEMEYGSSFKLVNPPNKEKIMAYFKRFGLLRKSKVR